MAGKGFERLFRFIPMALEEKEKALFVKELTIVFNFVLGDIVVEFVQFLAFILVMKSLSEEKETRTFLALFGLLLLF